MTRADGLAIINAMRQIERATVYLVLPTGALRVGTESWRHEAAVLRDNLLQILHRHERLFADAGRVLRSHDDWSTPSGSKQ